MTNEEKIIWKPYPDYPFIEANQFGEVRTTDRVVTRKNGRNYCIKGHILIQYLSRGGYMRVSFRVNGKLVHLSVHRIVASAFIPNPDNLPEVDHIDCDRTNNAVSNLRWVTRQENIAHREELGHGVYNNPEKPVIAVNLETGKVLKFKSQHEAARQLGVRSENINAVLKGRQKTTGGYWFCYDDEHAIENVREKFGDTVASEVEELIKGGLKLR